MGPVAGPCERTTARGCRGGAGSFGEARVPSVSGPNDYVALRGTPDDRIGWIKGRLVFLYYPNGRRALVPVRTALRSPRRACPSNRRCGRLRAVWWRRSRDPPVRDCGRFGVKVGARGAQGSPRRRCRLRAGPWGGRGGRYGARGASGPLRVELASRLQMKRLPTSADPLMLR